MKITRRFAGRKVEPHRGRIVRAALVQLLQALEPMTRARMFIADARQLRFGVAHRFMTADDSVNSRFAFRLKLYDAGTRIAKLKREAFRFELSFGVLARGAVAFTREAFGLLRQTFEREGDR